MGDVIVWAVVGGAVALLTQRKTLAILLGVIVAIIGTVIQAGVLAAALGAALGAKPPGGGPSVLTVVARDTAIGVAVVAVAGVVVVCYLAAGGSVGRRR